MVGQVGKSAALTDADVQALMASKLEALASVFCGVSIHPQSDVSNCVSVDATDKRGRTVLHHASHTDNIKLMKWMLHHGANPNATDKNGFSPLAVAASTLAAAGTQATATLLEDSRTFADTRDVYGLAPLHKAAGFGKTAVLALLLERAEVDVDCLTAPVCVPEWYEAAPSLQETALHCATRGGKHHAVAVLLDHGASTWVQNVVGDTPLHCAAKAGSWKGAHQLVVDRGSVRGGSGGGIENGTVHNASAGTQIQNQEGDTPCDVASKHGWRGLAMALNLKVLRLVPSSLNSWLGSGESGTTPAV